MKTFFVQYVSETNVPIPRPRTTKTLLVVLLLGLAGTAGVLWATSAVAMGHEDDGVEYSATEVDPWEDPRAVANESNAVFDVAGWPSDTLNRTAVDRAVDDGPVTVRDPERGLVELTDHDFAVYEGTYFRVDGSGDEDRVEFALEPVSADTVLDELAVQYADADRDVQRVVDEGEGTVSDDAPSIVERDGRYYALSRDVGAVFSAIAATAALGVLGPVSHAYLGVAVGVLAATARAGRRRVLDLRTVLAVAVVAVAVHVLLSVVGPGELRPAAALTGVVNAGTVLALGTVTGVGAAVRTPRTLRTALVAVAVGAVAVLVQSVGAIGFALGGADWGTPVLAAGVFSVLTSTMITVLVVGSFGVPLAVLGYVHADRATGESAPDAKET